MSINQGAEVGRGADRTRRRRPGRLLAPVIIPAVGAGLLLTACGSSGKPLITNLVTITYHKTAACDVFEEDPNATPLESQTPGIGLFVLYTIDSIANTDSKPEDFTFDTHKVYTTDGGSLSGQNFSNHFTVTTRSVPAGTTANSVGWFALTIEGDPKDLLNSTDHLQYHAAAGPGVLMVDIGDKNDLIGNGLCTPANVP